MTTKRAPGSFYCGGCNKTTKVAPASWGGGVRCVECGDNFQCQECGFEISRAGNCQRSRVGEGECSAEAQRERDAIERRRRVGLVSAKPRLEVCS